MARSVGYLRAASYGHTLGGAVGLAMVEGHGEAITPAWLAAGSWTVEINGAEHAATVSLRPFYDPDQRPHQEVAARSPPLPWLS